jgi:hypothetical protein
MPSNILKLLKTTSPDSLYSALNLKGSYWAPSEGGLGKTFQESSRHPQINLAFRFYEQNAAKCVAVSDYAQLYHLALIFLGEENAVPPITINPQKAALVLALGCANPDHSSPTWSESVEKLKTLMSKTLNKDPEREEIVRHLENELKNYNDSKDPSIATTTEQREVPQPSPSSRSKPLNATPPTGLDRLQHTSPSQDVHTPLTSQALNAFNGDTITHLPSHQQLVTTRHAPRNLNHSTAIGTSPAQTSRTIPSHLTHISHAQLHPSGVATTPDTSLIGSNNGETTIFHGESDRSHSNSVDDSPPSNGSEDEPTIIRNDSNASERKITLRRSQTPSVSTRFPSSTTANTPPNYILRLLKNNITPQLLYAYLANAGSTPRSVAAPGLGLCFSCKDDKRPDLIKEAFLFDTANGQPTVAIKSYLQLYNLAKAFDPYVGTPVPGLTKNTHKYAICLALLCSAAIKTKSQEDALAELSKLYSSGGPFCKNLEAGEVMSSLLLKSNQRIADKNAVENPRTPPNKGSETPPNAFRRLGLAVTTHNHHHASTDGGVPSVRSQRSQQSTPPTMIRHLSTASTDESSPRSQLSFSLSQSSNNRLSSNSSTAHIAPPQKRVTMALPPEPQIQPQIVDAPPVAVEKLIEQMFAARTAHQVQHNTTGMLIDPASLKSLDMTFLMTHSKLINSQCLLYLLAYLIDVQRGAKLDHRLDKIRLEPTLGFFRFGHTHAWRQTVTEVKQQLLIKTREEALAATRPPDAAKPALANPQAKVVLDGVSYQQYKKLLSVHTGRFWATWGKTNSLSTFEKQFEPMSPTLKI